MSRRTVVWKAATLGNTWILGREKGLIETEEEDVGEISRVEGLDSIRLDAVANKVGRSIVLLASDAMASTDGPGRLDVHDVEERYRMDGDGDGMKSVRGGGTSKAPQGRPSCHWPEADPHLQLTPVVPSH